MTATGLLGAHTSGTARSVIERVFAAAAAAGLIGMVVGFALIDTRPDADAMGRWRTPHDRTAVAGQRECGARDEEHDGHD